MRRIHNPLCIRAALVVVAATGLVGFVGSSASAAPPQKGPTISIPLDTLGFDAIPARLLVSGATMFTLHFVDDTHLLLTFNTHGLIPRLPDKAPGDDDRLVNALLLELPSGKVVARTQWHTRDREQYLYPLAHGLFLLRIRSRLTVIDPVRGLAGSGAFTEVPFLELRRRIAYISTSPGAELLAIETIAPPAPAEDDAARFAAATGSAASADAAEDAAHLTQIQLFRLIFDARPGEPIHLAARLAGKLAARNPIHIPATAEGFLDVSRESAGTWLFDFQSHAGKRIELAPFDSTCAPNPWFVSRSEFVALGCNGGDIRGELSGFNLRGEQPWIQILPGQHISPIVLRAPEAGRLAFSRILLGSSFTELENLSPGDLTAQEIQVLQHHDGRILLKVLASPIQRAGQNFDLSPDGLSFTVIRDNKLEVYRLPPLTKKDQDQLKLATRDIPEPNQAAILLTRAGSSLGTKSNALPEGPGPAPRQTITVAPAPDPGPIQPATPAGDSGTSAGDEAPRQRPSLYDAEHPKPPL